MDEYMAWPMVIPVVAIIGAFTYVIVAALAKARVRELEIRERIAMIERGIVPPPEVDPQRFDRVMDRIERVRRADYYAWPGTGPGSRHRRAGVALMGVGFGLMVLIAFAGEAPGEALGVGGFLVIIGFAFFLNSLFEARQPPPYQSGGTGSGPTMPNNPPPSTPPSGPNPGL